MDNKFPLNIYEGESVDRSRIDIERKTCDIRTWRKHLFFDYPPATLTHMSQRFTSAPKPAAQKPQPLPHLRFNPFVISESFVTKMAISRSSYEPFYATNTSHIVIHSLTDTN
jgi:hypothetical protein